MPIQHVNLICTLYVDGGSSGYVDGVKTREVLSASKGKTLQIKWRVED